MESSEKFNEESALRVISSMIEATRSNVRDNSFYYLLWGFIVLAASLLEYVLLRYVHYPHHYIGWPILTGIGTLITVIDIIRKYGKSNTSTYLGSFFMYFFFGWGISFLLLLVFVIDRDNLLVQPLILTMYALIAFVSGGILRFRPMIWGGIIAWAAAVASYLSPFPVQLLITAGTIIIGYIVPAFMMRKRNLNPVNAK
jgi:hypothetical protein